MKTSVTLWQLYNIKDDISAIYNISAKYTHVVKERVSDVKKWSDNHIQPRWFHNEATGKSWRKHNMPRFDKTFKMD